ncbi:hypothetical protein PQI51_03170 [Microbacterium esteraromaticum]|uniref:hypothetical protein n=1 Tax=Microbacterium esteraromaticum TaxID=57043 RepID=UPI0030A9941D
MAKFEAFSCDGVTGAYIDQIPVSAFTWNRLLSARGEGTATIQIDGTHDKAQLRDLLQHWSRVIRLDRDGQTQYMGYIVGRPYWQGRSSVQVKLVDLWGLLDRRGAWDHTAPNVELWKQTVTGSLRDQAVAAIRRGRDSGPALPAMAMPVTLPGLQGGSISRTYYGYHVETVGDVLSDLLDEGLDIYFQPRRVGNGDGDWLMNAGPSWSSGVKREFHVNADDVVISFTENSDAMRVTNNARYVGEGSEVDMLVRSNRNTASPYPLLDRITDRKNISNTSQLTALANQDLVAYEHPTFQWDFQVTADTQIDVGDEVRLWFVGDPWIADGAHDRRVVKVSGGLGDKITVSVQPTGGA